MASYLPDFASTVTQIVIEGGKAIYDYHSYKETEKDYKQAAKRTETINDLNLRAQEAENAERERRALKVAEHDTAVARARAGASGANINTGSVADYLSVLESENMQEYEWMKDANTAGLEVQKMEGESQVKSLKNQAKSYGRQATGALIGGGAKMYETGMDAGGWSGKNAWWA